MEVAANKGKQVLNLGKSIWVDTIDVCHQLMAAQLLLELGAHVNMTTVCDSYESNLGGVAKGCTPMGTRQTTMITQC